MQQDALLTFSQAQAVTADVASTSYLDLKAVRNAGVGTQLFVVCVCTVAMTDGASNSTCTVALEGDSTTTFTPDYTRNLFTFAALSPAGTVKYSALGPSDLNLQYAQLKYTMANGDLTTGSFTAFITKDIQQYTAYADNITIS